MTMHDWNKICCAVDFSASSRAAMERAADLATRLGSELTLLYVNQAAVAATAEAGLSAAEMLEDARREVEPKMDDWRSWAERVMGRLVRMNIVAGRASEEIVRFVRAGVFDLLVIGTHARVGIARLVLGSVAEEVQRHASCPVLVVRGG